LDSKRTGEGQESREDKAGSQQRYICPVHVALLYFGTYTLYDNAYNAMLCLFFFSFISVASDFISATRLFKE
jgi:hypothetical protein